MSATDPLGLLAEAYGVQTTYRDQAGAQTEVSPESTVAVLRALGAPIDGAGDAAEALRLRRRADAERGAPPTVVAWDGRIVDCPVLVPGPRAAVLRATIEMEDGSVVEATAEPEGDETVEGTRYRRFAVGSRRGLDLGYHRLVLEAPGWNRTCTVIAAPARAPAPGHRLRGVFAPLYALHSADSIGAGNLSDLTRLARWVSSLGGDLVGTLPILAAFLDDPCEPSPYAPVSRLMWNELFLDLERVPEVSAGATAAAPRPSGGLVDHHAQAAFQRSILAPLADRLAIDHPARQADLDRFLADRPDVARYATFRALGERHGVDWRHWPAPLAAGRTEEADFDPSAAGYHAYVQWLADAQVASTIRDAHEDGVVLYIDLPVGVHRDGWDAWERQDLFADELSVGAPPDIFFSRGQDWGFSPLHPQRSSAEGHRYFRSCLAHQASVASVLRIDHVMALHRLWCVPAGGSAADGAYVAQPAEELWATVLLESHRNRCVMVGENLGTVPPAVEEAMDRHGVAGMYVLQFDAQADTDPPLGEPTPGWLAMLNTHDTPTFAAWWTGADIDDRLDLGLVDADEAPALRKERADLRRALSRFLAEDGDAPSEAPDDILAALLRRLGESDAGIAVVALEDLWLETEPQNVPGTTTERPNWRRLAALDLETVTADPAIADLLRNLLQGGDAS